MTSQSSSNAVPGAEIARAAEYLRAGELVAFPTETVYGLGANALDADAVRKIYAAKGRPDTSPVIVHVDSIEMARDLAAEWSETTDALARAFWPGPLTLVVPKRLGLVPDIVTAGLATVGLRMPAHPVALALIRAAGVPLAAPSANRFTELSPTTAEHVHRALGDRVRMVIDGGPCEVGIESTVVSLATGGARPRLLRPGKITGAQIAAVARTTIDVPPAPQIVPEDEAHASPGLHAKHYSPRTPLLIEGRHDVPTGTRRIARLSRRMMPDTPDAYAAGLYSLLHRLDAGGYDAIVVELPPDTPEWAAVRDRLLRAAAASPVE